ncbi:MAG: efflux RND transporter periplasmic adaptor subunit [bacterium]|nr:efflux RND transporter periplasmic adaptor subunit [bacterium]
MIGLWVRSCAIVVAGGWLALVAAGCGKKAETELPPPEVLVTEVGQRPVSVYGEWVGTLDGFINAQIRAKVQGYLLKREYDEGTVVQAGQVLFQLDPRQYQAALAQAKGDVEVAQAVLLRSQQNVARYRPLVEKGAVSRKELDDAVQTMRANMASVDVAKAAVDDARLNLDWATVRSPITGIAGIAQAQVGDLIAATTLMTTVSQVDPIKVYFPISEREYLSFAERPQYQRPVLELFLADGSTYPQAGKVSAVNREVELATGSIQIQAEFPNPHHVLRPGGYAKIRGVVNTVSDAVLVPQRAVQEVQGNFQLVVVGADDTVQIRPVQVGEKSGDEWVITSGVKPGERVVVEGLQRMRDGIAVVPKPWTPPPPTAAKPAATAGTAASGE